MQKKPSKTHKTKLTATPPFLTESGGDATHTKYTLYNISTKIFRHIGSVTLEIEHAMHE